MAYCLFGIFDVQFAPLYGEDFQKAFRRFQEEIIKTSTDLSFLAWDKHYRTITMYTSLMAEGPEAFEYLPYFVTKHVNGLEPFQLTNKGLHVTLPLMSQHTKK